MSTHAHRHNVIREDSPTRTKGLQDTYRRELGRRFRKLRGVIRETIVANDALRIKGGHETRLQQDIESRDDFEFERSFPKHVAFMQQLREWLDEGVLEPATEAVISDGQHYTAIYVDAAYREGLEFANRLLVDRGAVIEVEDVDVVFSRPVHVRELETVYSRNYEALEDITEDIDRTVSNILTRSLRQGWGTRKTADEITKEVHDVQRTRARAMARTETLNAHNTGAVNRYDEFGVSEVEILTHNPCPVCQRIEANDPYSIGEAYGLVPAHPNCVCTVAPIL